MPDIHPLSCPRANLDSTPQYHIDPIENDDRTYIGRKPVRSSYTGEWVHAMYRKETLVLDRLASPVVSCRQMNENRSLFSQKLNYALIPILLALIAYSSIGLLIG